MMEYSARLGEWYVDMVGCMPDPRLPLDIR